MNELSTITYEQRYKEFFDKLFTKDTIVAQGISNGIPFIIKDYGSHHCAYIALTKEHPLYGKDWCNDDVQDIEVNGGMTFSEPNGEYWILGWDYSHLHDIMNPTSLENIKKEVKEATKQLSQKTLGSIKYIEDNHA